MDTIDSRPRFGGRLQIKVCCMASVSEAALAVRLGADAIGLVSTMPSGPGEIPEARIAEIVAAAPPAARFLLTSQIDPLAIAAQQRRTGADTVQLVDRLPAGSHADLRRLLPGVTLVQVVHVRGAESVAEALVAAEGVDRLLLDSGNPGLAVKQLGGTGRTHDWGLSREIVGKSPVPVYLAGGLRPDNVAAAVAAVRPFGVDVCSGVRTDGRLDAGKLEGFVAAARLGDTRPLESSS